MTRIIVFNKILDFNKEQVI